MLDSPEFVSAGQAGLDCLATSVFFSNFATYGVERAAETPDSTALGRRSMVRMGPVVRATEGPTKKAAYLTPPNFAPDGPA